MSRRLRHTWWGRTVAGVGLAALAGALALPGAVMLPGAVASVQSGGGSATAVPKNFRANSITWDTPKNGWVLGTGKCSPAPCSDVIGTIDDGKSWRLVGSVPAPIATQRRSKALGVTEIRFATPKVGWAFDPALQQTTDGGRTWAPATIPGGGQQVLSLATNSTEAYAVVSACKWLTGICKKPLTFWHTTSLTGGSWTQIPLDLPVNLAANVSVFGRTVYVIDPLLEFGADDKLYASTDGRHFSSRPAPCDHTQDLELTQAVATSATDVALLCYGDPGFSKAVKIVYRSSDTGKTDTSAGMAGLYGIQSQLAASPSGNLAIASQSDGSFLYINDTHKKTWTMVEGIGDGGLGWNDIVYSSGQEAWVVYSPAALFDGLGQLYVTRDGGKTWAVAPY